MTALELLDSLNVLDETERIEAKRASEAGKSILETICAFANEPALQGGWLLLGVVRDEQAAVPNYQVEGISQPEKLSTEIATQCRSRFNQPVRVEISTQPLDGKTVLVLHVPEAQPQDKPVFFRAQGLPKGAFRRISSTDQHCTDDDLAVFYQGRQSESFDASLVADACLDDLQPEAIADYRQYRAEANPEAQELRWSDEDLLQSLGCIRRNPQGAVPAAWQPTVAGLMLFGKPVALRRCFPMMRVDYIRVPGREWVPQPDRRFDTVDLRDPLLPLIRRALAAVLDDLPKTFALQEGDLQRQDIPAIPLRVIREAIVNALMHRNYRSHSPVQIIRYANRLEIRNAGFSLKSQDQLGEPGSALRNPKIASALYDTRLAETKGSGIRVMRESMAQAGLTPPLFESDRGNDLFVARYFFHHFLGEDDIAWLAQFKDLHLSEDEAKALIVVREAGALNNSTYRELTQVDALTASQTLCRLRDAGLLTQKGRGSATYYVPTDRLLDKPLSTSPDSLLSKPDALSAKLGDLLSNPSRLLSDPDGLLSNPGRALFDDVLRSQLLNGLPGALAAKVGAIGQRHPPEEVRELVVALCQLRAWRTDELSNLLRRRSETVRQHYLRPLMREGRLTMTRPQEPNDPQQAYRTAPEPV